LPGSRCTFRCPRLSSSIARPDRAQICTTKNRMPRIGHVRDCEG
jgi:hypothetical protein